MLLHSRTLQDYNFAIGLNRSVVCLAARGLQLLSLQSLRLSRTRGRSPDVQFAGRRESVLARPLGWCLGPTASDHWCRPSQPHARRQLPTMWYAQAHSLRKPTAASVRCSQESLLARVLLSPQDATLSLEWRGLFCPSPSVVAGWGHRVRTVGTEGRAAEMAARCFLIYMFFGVDVISTRVGRLADIFSSVR